MLLLLQAVVCSRAPAGLLPGSHLVWDSGEGRGEKLSLGRENEIGEMRTHLLIIVAELSWSIPHPGLLQASILPSCVSSVRAQPTVESVQFCLGPGDKDCRRPLVGEQLIHI